MVKVAWAEVLEAEAEAKANAKAEVVKASMVAWAKKAEATLLAYSYMATVYNTYLCNPITAEITECIAAKAEAEAEAMGLLLAKDKAFKAKYIYMMYNLAEASEALAKAKASAKLWADTYANALNGTHSYGSLDNYNLRDTVNSCQATVLEAEAVYNTIYRDIEKYTIKYPTEAEASHNELIALVSAKAKEAKATAKANTWAELTKSVTQLADNAEYTADIKAWANIISYDNYHYALKAELSVEVYTIFYSLIEHIYDTTTDDEAFTVGITEAVAVAKYHYMVYNHMHQHINYLSYHKASEAEAVDEANDNTEASAMVADEIILATNNKAKAEVELIQAINNLKSYNFNGWHMPMLAEAKAVAEASEAEAKAIAEAWAEVAEAVATLAEAKTKAVVFNRAEAISSAHIALANAWAVYNNLVVNS